MYNVEPKVFLNFYRLKIIDSLEGIIIFHLNKSLQQQPLKKCLFSPIRMLLSIIEKVQTVKWFNYTNFRTVISQKPDFEVISINWRIVQIYMVRSFFFRQVKTSNRRKNVQWIGLLGGQPVSCQRNFDKIF